MQISPVSSNTASYNAPVSGAVAAMLPKYGESAADALLAPVEAVAASTRTGAVKAQPDVYEKPRVQPRADDAPAAAETQEPGVAAAADDADEQDMLRELKQRDQEVRTHEQAHMSAGGQHTGAASYTYQTGPDGVRYAVGGEVSVDTAAVSDDPQATLEKMQQIQRAALAPAEPSAQDRQIAAQAGQQAAQAMNELTQERQAQRQADAEALQAEQQKVEDELKAARKEQERADEKERQQEQISAAERFAEYNARMQRINEVLLELSIPQPVSAGQILDDVV